MKVFYAHHNWIRDTKVEQYEISRIKELYEGCEIYNPTGDISLTKPYEATMEKWSREVKKSDRFVFSGVDGFVDKWTYDLIEEAKKHKISSFYLIRNTLVPIEFFKITKWHSNTGLIYAGVYAVE